MKQPNINNLGRNNSNLEAVDYGATRNMNNAMNNNNMVNFDSLDNDLVGRIWNEKIINSFIICLL